MRRTLLYLLLILSLKTISYAVEPNEALSKFLLTNGAPKGSVALKIVDLSDMAVMVGHNESLPLIPASIMKSVTTASLYGLAGADWRYHTKVYVDGPNELGQLNGNLIIVGACDPSLHSEVEPFGTDLIMEIAEILEQKQINRIEGDILIDETEFAGNCRPDSWAHGDHKKYYGTGSHAFNFSNNASGDFAIENPSGQFTSGLIKELNKRGIKIEGKKMTEGKRQMILDHVSPPLDDIMRSCMMRSDNLFAECMLRTFGKLSGTDGSTELGAREEMALWDSKGFDLAGVNIVDGSGLSRQNRMTVDFMADLLVEMSKDPVYASFFPLAGQEGTMRKFLANTSLDSYLAMKTGSMNGIQCYAGYKLDDDYVPTHVIVIMINDMKAREKAKKASQQLLLDLFEN